MKTFIIAAFAVTVALILFGDLRPLSALEQITMFAGWNIALGVVSVRGW